MNIYYYRISASSRYSITSFTINEFGHEVSINFHKLLTIHRLTTHNIHVLLLSNVECWTLKWMAVYSNSWRVIVYKNHSSKYPFQHIQSYTIHHWYASFKTIQSNQHFMTLFTLFTRETQRPSFESNDPISVFCIRKINWNEMMLTYKSYGTMQIILDIGYERFGKYEIELF